MTASDLRTLLAEPACTFLWYVFGSLLFSLADHLLPVGPLELFAFAVVTYGASAKWTLTSRVPSPSNGIDYTRERGVGNYGRWQARRFVGTMLTILVTVGLSAPVFFGELTRLGKAAESSFTTLYYLGAVPTAYWTANRLTAQYLPTYSPDLYPDDYTRPLDERPDE